MGARGGGGGAERGSRSAPSNRIPFKGTERPDNLPPSETKRARRAPGQGPLSLQDVSLHMKTTMAGAASVLRVYSLLQTHNYMQTYFSYSRF